MTPGDLEKRLLRACKTIRALPDTEHRFRMFRSGSWPDAPHSAEDAYGWDYARVPRFRPSPADVSDCLPALALMRGIPRRDQRLVWWRSLDWSFGQIAMRIGRSDETARRRYRDIILRVWVGLHGP